MTNAAQEKIVYTIYSDTKGSCLGRDTGTYLCWDATDKYYYFGQKNDENILCWSSLETFNSFYAAAIKNLSIMKIPNLFPRRALLYKNK